MVLCQVIVQFNIMLIEVRLTRVAFFTRSRLACGEISKRGKRRSIGEAVRKLGAKLRALQLSRKFRAC